MRPRSRRHGFTIIELLVSMVITTIVVANVLLVLTTQHRSAVGQERVLEVQQDARLVTELIVADTRMAGFLVPRIAGIASLDGGAGGSDTLCVSDPGMIVDPSVTAAMGRFDRASVEDPLLAGVGTVRLVAASMDIDGDGNNDFGPNQGIIISDGTDSHCARIQTVVANDITFTPNTPGGFAVGPPSGRAVPALIYEFIGGGLQRNLVMLSTQVEDVQVEFGVDANGNDRIEPLVGEFPIDDLDATDSDPSLVRAVRLSITTRTPNQDPRFQGAGFTQIANRGPGAADNFRRRRFIAGVFPRNLQ